MVKLPWGFSPWQATQQAVDNVNPFDGYRNRDMFSEKSTTGYGVLGVQSPGSTWTPNYSKPANAPVAPTGPYTDTSGGSGGGSGSGIDPNASALYDQAIAQAQAGIGRLGNQESIGRDNIVNDYTSNLNRLLDAKARTERDYNTSKVNTTKDNISTRSDIDFATGQRANSLQRLLGARGAGSSSAARVAAPYAAALEGTQQLNDVTEAFTQNMGNLDQSWGDYNKEWSTNRKDLDRQKELGLKSVETDVASKRADLLSTIADLQSRKAQATGGDAVAAAQPYLAQVNQLYGQIDNLGRQYDNRVKVADPTYNAPDLAAYEYDPRTAVEFAQTAGTQAVNPYLSLLLGNKDKKQNPLV